MTPRIRSAAALAAIFLVSACGRGPGAAAVSAGAGVKFEDVSFDEALSRARSGHRLVLVDVYTDWCGWCRKMDRDVFSDPRAAAASRGLLAVRVNAERGGESVAERYRVDGFPTLLVLDGEGNEILRISGYVGVEEFEERLSALPGASS